MMQTSGNPPADPAVPEELDALGDGLDEIQETDIDEGEAATADEAGEEGGEADERRDGGQEEAGDVRPRSARAGRSERARAEARELRERLERTNRELDALRATVQQPRLDPAAQARAEAEEQERVSLMDPAQQIQYWRNKDRQQFLTYMQGAQLDTADRIDRAAWDSAAQIDPMRSRYSARVEAEIAQARQQGRNPDRRTVYELLVGRDVLAQRAAKLGQQQNGARRRVAGQTTQPAGGRGDVVRQRAPARDADEALLRSIRIDDV